MNRNEIALSSKSPWSVGMAAALILFLLGLWMPATSPAKEASGEHPPMVLVTGSKKSFPETLKAFQEEARKAGWSVLNVNNMAGVLSERGFTLHPVVIIDICSGSYSAAILRNDDYRPISALMPCRVSIYQASTGEVFISRMNASAFAGMMPPEVAEIMAASDKEVSEIIAKTIG